MRHNRVLSLAIATALSAGVNMSHAGDLTIKYGGAGSSANVTAGPAKFAAEYFFNNSAAVVLDGLNFDGTGADDNLDNSGADGPAKDGTYNDRFLYAIYDVKSTLTSNFIAQFALDNGAQFGSGVSLGTGTSLDFVAHPSGTHIAATLSGAFGEGGSEGDTQVSFLVQPSETSNTFRSDGNSKLFLRFKLKNLTALSSPGEEIKLTVKLFGASGSPQVDTPAPTEVVATSKRGANIVLDAATGTAEIDVSTGSINFIRDVDGPTLASLGSVSISTVTDALKADGSAWTFATDSPLPASATLTVTDGNFAASLQDPGRVFLDVDNDNCAYDASTSESDITLINDILADTLEADMAMWELTKAQLQKITAASNAVGICIEADGQTEINDFSEPPQATFVIDYGGGNTDPFTSKMRQIKRNGSVCTLYLVPNPNAQQIGNIRVTNLSGQEGKLLGTLRDSEGRAIFTNKTLVEAVAANETVRLTATNLDAVEKDPDWLTYWTADTDNNPDGLETGWSGQGVLTISSNLSNMEVYGLVRNKAGGPLTNMSVGGTGNGCD